MDRDLALQLIDILDDIKDALGDIKDALGDIVTNTTPADSGGDADPDAEQAQG